MLHLQQLHLHGCLLQEVLGFRQVAKLTMHVLLDCVVQAAQHMTRLTSLQLQDLLPDR